MLKEHVKRLLSQTILHEGSVRTIMWGPARGLRYRIFPGFGLAPLHGGWERRAQALLRKHLRPGDTVYDVGANYGMHTLLMARCVGPKGKVFAFEPVPAIRAELEKNIQLNGFRHVTVQTQALDNYSGQAE